MSAFSIKKNTCLESPLWQRCRSGGHSPQICSRRPPVLAARWRSWRAFAASPVLLQCFSYLGRGRRLCCSLPGDALNMCTWTMLRQRCRQAPGLAVHCALADHGGKRGLVGPRALIPQDLAAPQPSASRPERMGREGPKRRERGRRHGQIKSLIR